MEHEEEYYYTDFVELRAKLDGQPRWKPVSNGEFDFQAVGALTPYTGTVKKWMCDTVVDEGGVTTPIAWYKKAKMINVNKQLIPEVKSQKCFSGRKQS